MIFIACYENTPAGISAVKTAQQHAKVWEASIEVVSTLTRDIPIKHARLKEKEEQLELEVRKLFLELPYLINVSLLTDDLEAGEQIVNFAERKKADLIFLGIKKKSRVGKILFGSNAQYIILNAPCPVMIVR
jgi:nucleotide-binding universal stress UspA family protein